MLSRSLTLLLVLVVGAVVPSSGQSPADKTSVAHVPLAPDEPLPGMPRYSIRTTSIPKHAPDKLSLAVRSFPSRLYVPNGISNTVDVIDPDLPDY